MNKVIDKGFRSCRFVSTIVKHPVHARIAQPNPAWANFLSTLLTSTKGSFYKKVTTCEPLPIKLCVTLQIHNI